MLPAMTLVTDPARPKLPSEYVHDNVYWRGAAACISVCVPVYRYDVTKLLDALAACKLSALVEIIFYDDGSGDTEMLTRLMGHAGHTSAAVRIVAGALNRGRSAARNAATRHARGEWILLLDADMMPDGPRFLEAYFNAVEAAARPAVIVGGYSLASAPRSSSTDLHRWQAITSECIDATARSKAPGRYVFSSNVLIHRDVLATCPFDEAFAGWGWEDTDWGLRLQKQFPVIHIDNTATHLGLDSDTALMAKYEKSGANFARMAIRHADEVKQMALFRHAQRLRKLPMRNSLKATTAGIARARLLPLALRGRALKAWRALVYADKL
jgi:glycosyltransferase involved in cell wall biosynthesis